MNYSNIYTELKVIGKGSYGKKYAGQACLIKKKQTGQYFISKKICVANMPEKELARVRQEVNLMEKFSHPCIVTYIESFVMDEFIVIVMEYCAGGDLEQLIKFHKDCQSFFPEFSVKDWLAQLASALSHIHNLKIIHRDIKPSNIFLTYDGKLKLGDFGVSKILEHTNDSAHTVIGTPLYMSPEVCANKAYTYKSDVWSLGCVLYEICTFNKPFWAESFVGLALKILNEQPESIPEVYSDEFCRVVFWLLEKEADKRPNAREILADLGMEGEYSVIRHDSGKILEWSAEDLEFESLIGNTVSNNGTYEEDFESFSYKEESEKYEDDFDSI